MSWIDLAKDNLIIVTGDGREYKPLWKEPRKVLEFNISQFEFPGVEGSIVSRGTLKGRKFPLEIYFVGENHIDDCDRFEVSVSDPRHWVVTHPYYGNLNVHPTTIEIDNTGGNVSKITMNLIETIVEDSPKGIEVPADRMLASAVTLGDTVNTNVVATIPTPTTLDKNTMVKNVGTIYGEGNKKIKNGLDVQNYFNLYNEATTAILNATDDVFHAMVTIQAMINAPFQFIDTVKNRFNMLKNQFTKLIDSLFGVGKTVSRKADKIIFQHNAALIITAMAEASVTNIDYTSAEEVLTLTEDLIDTYNLFVDKMDEIQTDNGGDEDSFIADPDAMLQLQDLVNYTVANLLSIALDSKQERSIIVDKDTNIILLAHRFYGLKPDDSTINYLIATNNLGLYDLLQIPAGRKIKYYV